MDQAFNAWLQFNECTVIGDVRDATREARIERIFRFNRFPRISQQLLDAERDAVRFMVDLDDLNLELLTDGHHFRRMVDAAPCHVGDVQQTINTTEIDECAVFGDVLDGTVNGLTFLEIGNEFGTGLCARLFEHATTRNNDVAATTIHFQDQERLYNAHQRADITDRTDVDLAARQEGGCAIKIDRIAALDDVEDNAVDLLLLLERLLKLDPAFLAARFVARDNGFTKRVFDPVEIDFDFIANARCAFAAWACKFT